MFKVVVQSKRSARFYSAPNSWVGTVEEAHDFKNVICALDCCLHEHIGDTSILMHQDGAAVYDVALDGPRLEGSESG